MVTGGPVVGDGFCQTDDWEGAGSIPSGFIGRDSGARPDRRLEEEGRVIQVPVVLLRGLAL